MSFPVSQFRLLSLPNLLPNFSEVGWCMAIGFSEWNQRNSDTERRTMVPNLWGAGRGCAGVPHRFTFLTAYADCIRAGYFNL